MALSAHRLRTAWRGSGHRGSEQWLVARAPGVVCWRLGAGALGRLVVWVPYGDTRRPGSTIRSRSEGAGRVVVCRAGQLDQDRSFGPEATVRVGCDVDRTFRTTRIDPGRLPPHMQGPDDTDLAVNARRPRPVPRTSRGRPTTPRGHHDFLPSVPSDHAAHPDTTRAERHGCAHKPPPRTTRPRARHGIVRSCAECAWLSNRRPTRPIAIKQRRRRRNCPEIVDTKVTEI
jgi:hypothetical protein